MELTYTNKTVLVSGAGRGIGRSVALEFAKAGCTVICVSRNPDSCGKVAQEIVDGGGKAEAFACDVSKGDDVRNLCLEVLKKYDTVDILINNAGITKDMLLIGMKDEAWQDVIDTNLSSCFYFAKNLSRNMMAKRWGRIINISSVVGIMGNAGQANYAAAKAGIIGLTKSLAREFAARNITVNALAPGFIETDMTSVLSAQIKESVKTVIPQKKMGSPEDIATACAFLASDQASYITGQVLAVDGGMSM